MFMSLHKILLEKLRTCAILSMIHKRFTYRLFPTSKQNKDMNGIIDLCQEAYNFFLSVKRHTYQGLGISMSKYDLDRQIKYLRNNSPKFQKVYAQVLCEVTSRVDTAFKAFFRRFKNNVTPGFPRYKGKGQYNSFTYPQIFNNISLIDNKLNLPKIGKVKIKLHRPLEGKPKTCSVRKSPTNKWYVIFTCECEEPTPLPKNDLKVGIDLGLKTFAQFSDGNKVENPRFFKKEEKSVSKARRNLSTTNKYTQDYSKRKNVVARVYERIKFKRHNFCHQESRKLINKYQVICLEDLSVKHMIEEKKLSKSVCDAAWTTFISMLEVKAAWAGRQVIKVNPAYTSQTCSSCGARKKLSLSDRTYLCENCGLEIDRDLNASKNILRLGLQSLGLSQDKAIEVH